MRTLWQVFQQKTIQRTDAELLRAFAVQKSEEAFSQLVEKYGGMVLSVCQRLLGHRQDAEDAFQATFLILAKKSAQLHGNSPLSCWLYGVARRVALKARTQRPREQQHREEWPDTTQEDLSMSLQEGAELRPWIDDAIASLPEAYRSTLVLCLLSGLTKAEAARQLGCPEGTVSSRLMRAKEMLRQKLVQRGITLASLAVLEPLLAPASVSASLTQSTVSLGMKVALGATLTVGTSSSILNLAQGASQAMYITKLKVTALCLFAAAGLTAGTGYVAGGWGQEKAVASQPTTPKVKAKLPAPTEAVKKEPPTKQESLITDSASVFKTLNRTSESLTALTAGEVPLSEYLQVLEESLGLPAIIDIKAFRNSSVEFNLQEFHHQKINLARMTNQSADTILRSLLDGVKVKDQNIPSSYMIRRGTIVIVPQDYITQAATQIMVAFDSTANECNLADALERLSLDTGVSIIVDARILEIARSTQIRTSFRNVRLLSAVKLLAGMADNANLAVLNIDGALYVSTSDNCRRMEEELSRGGQ